MIFAKTSGRNWPIADPRVPSNDPDLNPELIAGRISIPVIFSFLKWRLHCRLHFIRFFTNVVLIAFLVQEHDKQLFLLEQLQRQKLELEVQKREFEEQQKKQKEAELAVS